MPFFVFPCSLFLLFPGAARLLLPGETHFLLPGTACFLFPDAAYLVFSGPPSIRLFLFLLSLLLSLLLSPASLLCRKISLPREPRILLAPLLLTTSLLFFRRPLRC